MGMRLRNINRKRTLQIRIRWDFFYQDESQFLAYTDLIARKTMIQVFFWERNYSNNNYNLLFLLPRRIP